MGNTSIEWTDATWASSRKTAVSQRDPIDDLGCNPAIGLIGPFGDFLIALGAIAGPASRHDVPRVAVSAFDDGMDVVPRFGGLIAIGALSFELFGDRFHAFAGDRLDSPLPAPGVLDSLRSMNWVVGVSLTRLLRRVLPADTLAGPQSHGQPSPASAAPELARLSPRFPFLPGWLGRVPGAATVGASGRQSVRPRRIDSVATARPPGPAHEAPFPAGVEVLQVVIEGDADPPGRHFHRALFCLHGFPFLCLSSPFNYTGRSS
jgi:hypothetical protein